MRAVICQSVSLQQATVIPAVLRRHVERKELAVSGHFGAPLHCNDHFIPWVVLQHLPCGPCAVLLVSA